MKSTLKNAMNLFVASLFAIFVASMLATNGNVMWLVIFYFPVFLAIIGIIICIYYIIGRLDD